jgi:DUF1009 family protein
MATRTIGIIAGKGAYPEVFMAAARRQSPGCRLVMAAFEGETCPRVAGLADGVEWMRVGQLGRPIRFFLDQGVSEAVMVGQITPRNLFHLRPDLRTLKLLARLKERNAESLFGGIAEEQAADGIELHPATTFLEDLLPAAGPVCGPALKGRQLDDAAFGYRIAKETSRLDIGQTVVVRHGTVLAVEAFEGTDACIRRGAELGRGRHVMLVKVSKPDQDFRFDVPVVGTRTVEVCAEAGVRAITVEAGCTLILEQEAVAELCRKHKVGIHAIGEKPTPAQA